MANTHTDANTIADAGPSHANPCLANANTRAYTRLGCARHRRNGGRHSRFADSNAVTLPHGDICPPNAHAIAHRDAGHRLVHRRRGPFHANLHTHANANTHAVEPNRHASTNHRPDAYSNSRPAHGDGGPNHADAFVNADALVDAFVNADALAIAHP